MVLFCEVFEQDHVVLFIGIVDEDCLGANTQHLTDTHTHKSQLSLLSQEAVSVLCSSIYSTNLREAHQHQQGEKVGAFQSLWQLLNAIIGKGSDDCAPFRTSIQTV